VHALLQRAGVSHQFVGFVSDLPGDEQNEFFTGRQHELPLIARALQADEIIFCGSNLTNKQIIHYFESLGKQVGELKIVPAGSDFIIGSSSVDYPGDTYTPDFNLRISLPANKRNKRLIDLAASAKMLLLWPVFFWLYPAALRNPVNLWKVLIGKHTLIGYPAHPQLPALKPAALHIGSHLQQPVLQMRMRKAYVKDYAALMDVRYLWEAFRNSR